MCYNNIGECAESIIEEIIEDLQYKGIIKDAQEFIMFHLSPWVENSICDYLQGLVEETEYYSSEEAYEEGYQEGYETGYDEALTKSKRNK